MWRSSQDKPNAVSVSELHEALSLGTVTEDRKLFLLAAQLGSDGALRNSRRGLDTFQDLLLQLVWSRLPPPPPPPPPAEPKVGKQRDGFKQSSSSSSSSSSLSKLWHIWGGGRGDDEDCRNWCREMTESEWGDAKPRRSTQPCLALLLALCQTSVQPVFRKSWYWNSSRVILTLILLTGEEEEEEEEDEEEVHSEEDEDSRWDRRIKVCSRILWLTTATFTSCRWLRLWTFCLNVDLWRVLFKHIDSTVYNNVSCL